MVASERELLTQIAGGDQAALQVLYTAYRARLWGYVWQQLAHDSSRTEEIVQDVFMAVWRSAATYRGEAKVAAWLFRIAHNLAANAQRAQAQQIQAEPLFQDDGNERTDLLSRALEPEVVAQLTLADALTQLAPKHRTVIDLAFVQGFAPDEIAHILAIPPGTVRSRLSYARRALTTILAAANEEPATKEPTYEHSS